jgi:hypothetical protein
MKASTTTDMIVASGSGHATQLSLSCPTGDFRDNTYNKDSYLDEADMNS